MVSLIYADSGAYKLVRRNGKGKNFVGYIAVEDVPVGEKADVAIVWRGTITQDEWLQVNTRAQHMHACSTCSMSGTVDAPPEQVKGWHGTLLRSTKPLHGSNAPVT